MSLYKLIKEAYVNAEQQEFFRTLQQQNNLKWQQYWFDYWVLALILDNALKANIALIKVQPPIETRFLLPLDYKPKKSRRLYICCKS